MKLKTAWSFGWRLIWASAWLAGWLGLFRPSPVQAAGVPLLAPGPQGFAPTATDDRGGNGPAARAGLTATVTSTATLTPDPGPSPLVTLTPLPSATPRPQPTACGTALTRVKPAVIPADRTTVVTLNGTDFLTRSTLRLGEAMTLPTTYISSTALSAQLPPLVSGWYTATLATSDGCVTKLANAMWVAGPRLAPVTLNGGALNTTALTVTVGISFVVAADASKTIGVSFSADGVSWTRWTDYVSFMPWRLLAGEGLRTVYVRGVDWVGNVSPVVSATITLDPAAAAFVGVTIDQGGYFARAVTTTLTLGAGPGTAQMQVSPRPDFAGAKWEPYASRKTWVISPPVDLSTPGLVYVRYKDVRGKVSAAYQDDIIVDTQAPQGGVLVAAVAGVAASGRLMAADTRSYSFDESRFLRLALGDLEQAGIYLPLTWPPPETAVTVPTACPGCLTVQLDLPATDNLSGVGAVRVSPEPSFDQAAWELYTVKKLWTVPPVSGTVYVEYRDFAGNVSPAYTATVPAAPALSLPRRQPNHLGTEKVVLADYMMWYGPDTFSGTMTWDVPVAGPYDSSDPAIIRKQVGQAQQACLDGLAAHWYGPTDVSTTNNFDQLLAASAGTPLRHAIVIQTNILPGATEAMIVDAINYLSARWAQQPHYLRLGGRPVLIFTDMPRPWDDPLAALAGWQRIRQATDPGHAMIWMAEGLYPAYNPLFDGLYVYRIDHRDYQQGWLQQPRWANGLRDLEQHATVPLPVGGLYFADSISPGFDNTRLDNSPINFSSPAPQFARDRRDGGYYSDTFAVTAQTGGDFLLVKSFNEWIEGTEIEPGLTYGDRYLDLTCHYAALYRGR